MRRDQSIYVGTNLKLSIAVDAPSTDLAKVVHTDTSTTNQYVKFINNSFTLQVQGYDMINIHTTFAKSVPGASTAMDNLRLVPTDILWSLLFTNGPNSKTYFSNMNSAGKVIYFMPIMEEIEIYFTDEWGDRIIDQLDF